MNAVDAILWNNCSRGDDAACRELILSYLYLVKTWARRISRIATWTSQEDLIQEGVIGLINAVRKFDPNRNVPFERYASPYIRGAILDSSDLTRELARRQQEICGKIKRVAAQLTKILQRNPTIEEVADETSLTPEQILNAIDAMGVAFAGELSSADEAQASYGVQSPQQETAVLIHDALSRLSERERSVVTCYYLEDQSHEEIARRFNLTVSNVIKIRQRAIKKLRKYLT